MFIHPFFNFTIINEQVEIRDFFNNNIKVFPREIIESLEKLYFNNIQDDFFLTLQKNNLIYKDLKSFILKFDEVNRQDISPIPIVEQIELTNFCPYQCIMCPRPSKMTRSIGYMSKPLFFKIIEEISGFQNYVALHHFGESLFHRYLPDFIKYGNKKGVKTGLSINPSSLNFSIIDKILDAGLHFILISLDSLNNVNLKNIRGDFSDIEKSKRNILYLLNKRKKLNKEIIIYMQMIALKQNQNEFEEFLNFCEDMKVDRGFITPLGKWDFEYNELNKIGIYKKPLYNLKCYFPYKYLSILWDGKVVPCCKDYNGFNILGDLNHLTLKQIWASQKVENFRSNYFFNNFCSECSLSIAFKQEYRKKIGFKKYHKLQENKLSKTLCWDNPNSIEKIKSFEEIHKFEIHKLR